jgi:hypothetical protein
MASPTEDQDPGRPPESANRTRDGIEPASLRRRFGRIWPVHNDAFSELLVFLRRQFDGDLDSMLVLAIIGSRHLGRRAGGREAHWYGQPNDEAGFALYPINIQSIADYSGIARETVRRKVRDLECRGWILRSGKGYLLATEQLAIDHAPAAEAMRRYLSTVVAACSEATTD